MGSHQKPGVVARSEVCPLDMQAAPSSIPMSSTFFRGAVVMKKISMANLSLPLIQEEQLSVTGKRMCTKHWPRKLTQEQCVLGN